MRNRTRSSAGFSFIELLLIVALIGIITTILIPNLMDALHKSLQKRTVADMHAIATGMMSFYTDMHGGAAAGNRVYLKDYDPIAHGEVSDMLVPMYIDHLPLRDAWHNDYDYYFGKTTEEYGYELAFGIRSRGRSGEADNVAYTWGSFDPTLYDHDILWLDGLFVTWPEGTPNPGSADSAGDCDQGVGDGAEGCDPGNSTSPDNPTNDEDPDTGPGNPGKNDKT
jgi:general secretion pathway protein G